MFQLRIYFILFLSYCVLPFSFFCLLILVFPSLSFDLHFPSFVLLIIPTLNSSNLSYLPIHLPYLTHPPTLPIHPPTIPYPPIIPYTTHLLYLTTHLPYPTLPYPTLPTLPYPTHPPTLPTHPPTLPTHLLYPKPYPSYLPTYLLNCRFSIICFPKFDFSFLSLFIPSCLSFFPSLLHPFFLL